MTIAEFLSLLRSLDVRVWIEADQLRCRAPQGVLTSALRTELAERKQEIMTFLRGAELAVLSISPSIPPASRDQELPLSFAQQRLWFLDQLEPGSPFYNISATVQLVGRLHTAALRQGLDEIVNRHEILRTSFVAVDGHPVQVIAPALHMALPVVGLEAFPEAERQAQARRLAIDESQQPFDLARDPLLRVTLLRLSGEEHVLLLTMHHIVTDGWSMGIFIREMATLYRGFSAGRPAPLSRLPIQYADFAVWQRQWLHGEVLEKQLSYWRRQLGSTPAMLALPTDHPRPAVQTFQGARLSFVLPRQLSDALMVLGQAEQATPFMLLLAAFDALLYRYTNQDDIVVGSPITNRGWSETEGLIGFFVNTLALRIHLAGNLTFRKLLSLAREMTLAAYAHQDVPFEKLVEELQPERSLSRTPLFQVMFVFQNAPVETLTLPDLMLNPLEVDNQSAKFDLTLAMMQTPAGLSGSIEYNTDLFDRGTVARMLGHFQMLLAGIVANPDRQIADLPLLTEAEQHQLLVEWNSTQATYAHAAHTCIHELFEMQAAKTSDAVAIIFEEAHLTYRELNRRANHVAHELQRLGVGPEVLVGICVERSLEMLEGLLGILKAGAAYVPLDPSYPKQRLAFMLQDSQASVVLTQRRLVERLAVHEAQLVVVDASWDAAQAGEGNLASAARPENLAYVIYTSGSTGSPKGVAIEHRSAVALIAWGRDVFGPELLAGTLASTSICFDLSVFELFVPLSCGATVILAQTALHLPLLPAAQAVTLVNTVPSAMQALLNMAGLPGCVRVVNLAGELLQTQLVDQIYQHTTVEQVYDLYGPSEDTTYSTYALRSAAGPATIGRPIANTHVYLLDAHLNPVPIGALGELYIGGAGLARGYLNRPDLTAERFIPNPFLKDEGLRMKDEGGRFILHPSSFILYKTGDLARYRPDGSIEYLGRTDQQVKMRGFRIELGEIEAALNQHPAVQQGVVVAREDRPGDRRLVAYIVPKNDERPTTNDQRQGDKETRRQGEGEAETQHSALNAQNSSEQSAIYNLQSAIPETLSSILYPLSSDLRAFLKDKLPEYMLPTAFVLLASLPLTPSGKIDRRALPAPDQARPELERVFVAPRTPIEETLAGIWANVLNIKHANGQSAVGVLDNFFELGGHSLLATQVISRVRRALRVELPLRSLFEEPTLAGLAGRIESAGRAGAELSAPPIMPVAREGNVPLSFAQQRLWFLNQLEPASPAYNIPIAVRLSGQLNVTALRQSLSQITRRHEVLRTTFATVEGQPVQVIASTLSVPLPIIDLRELFRPGREALAQRLAIEDAQRPFDLKGGPLLRAALIELDEAEYVLLVTMHHIVSDAWSLGIFVRELVALYQSLATGKSVFSLSELPIQYADFAIWQRQWLPGKALEAQLAYWRQQLSGNLPVLELPTNGPRPLVKTYRGARQSFVLPKTTAEALKVLSQREGATLFMTLLAAFQTLLYRYTGQEDIVVGSPIANRNRIEIEGLIGFFTNTLAVRTDLSGNPTFRELLDRVREVMLSAHAYQDLPFEKLVEELQPQRDMSRDPLFQVMFVLQNVQNTLGGPVALPDLSLRPLEVDSATAKFDLTLFVAEIGNELSGAVEYNTDLFDAEAMMRWVGHFQTLLAGIVAQPQQHISDLPLLTEMEQSQLLRWNDTQVAYPQTQCLHELVEQQVESKPDAVAVVYERPTTNDQRPTTNDQRPTTNDEGQFTHPLTRSPAHPCTLQHLTYAALNRRANQLAHQLQGLGVVPDVPVCLCLERSLDMVVSVLGVLKAGGVYVPLDPTYPPERLAFMLEETRPAVLLADQQLLGNLPEMTGHRVCLDSDWPLLEHLPQSAPQCVSTPDNLLYILYTSGSTGKPKGVAMRHRPLVNLMYWQAQTTRLSQPARTLQFASLSFDVSCQEIFFTWSSGGTLVLISEDTRRDAARLLQVLNEASVERLFLPFVALQHLAQVADEQNAALPAQLREIITAGEQLHVTPDLQRFLQRLDGCVLHNHYGPTEGHVVAALTLEGAPAAWPALPPIGRPIANVSIYIVDSRLQPVPVGIPGELTIGSSALARGYLHRPDLTAERFVPNPFLKIEDRGLKIEDSSLAANRKLSSILYPLSSTRLYRTGDRARYLSDGTIEFMGRIDHQVKIRGFRIELGEIEAVLRQHPAVQQGVVVACEDQLGDRRLVAYIVPTTDHRPPTTDHRPGDQETRGQGESKTEQSAIYNLQSAIPETLSSIFYPLSSDLRAFLKDKLPDYMLPSAFVMLEALPLTPNGKLDRRALSGLSQTPERTGFEPAGALIAPRDILELRLVRIWEELLGVRPIGIRHNFFELGGHSLLAVRLMAHIKQELGVRLPLVRLFEGATVERLADVLRNSPEVAPASSLVKLRAGQSNKQPLFFVHPAGGNVLCYAHLVRYLDQDQPCYGLQAPGLNGEQELYTQLEAIARHHIDVLRTVQPTGPYLLSGWSLGGVVAFEMAQQFQAEGQPVALLALIDSHAPKGDRKSKVDEAALLAGLARDLGLPLRSPLDDGDRLEQLDLDGQLAHLLEKAKQANLVPSGIDLIQVRRLFQVFKSNLQAAKWYVPRTYPGPVTLFKASEQRGEPEENLGWGALVRGSLTVHMIPGDHETIVYEPNVLVLAEKLKEPLRTAGNDGRYIQHD